jgi:hypothetical protein
MSALVYVLCAATAALCAGLLLRAYFASGSSLLLWSGLCFTCLTIANALLVADRVLFPGIDLSTWRLLPSLAGMIVLLYGLIWHGD